MRLGRRHSRFACLLRAVAFGIVCTAAAALSGPAPAAPAGGGTGGHALLQSSKGLRIGVVGDSLAGDLADGLRKLMRARRDVHVVKFTKAATGLIRDDVYDWPDALRSFVRKNRLDVLVVLIGGNDRQSFWKDGRRLSRGSKAWMAEYTRRVSQFMDILNASGARIYWVGLPVVHAKDKADDYRRFNQIYQAQARQHGIRFIGTWNAFTDAEGNYTSFGPAADGVRRRLRKDDGLHFTTDGTVRFAQIVAGAIDRDMTSIGLRR